MKYFTLLCLITLLFVSQPVQAEAPEQTHNQVLGVKIALAIKKVETGGTFTAKGLSGERGSYQIMPSTWNALAKKHLGTTTKMTAELEEEVVLKEINSLLEKGYTPAQIALIWNAGHAGKCSKGTNKYGTPYDSCKYVQKVMNQLELLNEKIY